MAAAAAEVHLAAAVVVVHLEGAAVAPLAGVVAAAHLGGAAAAPLEGAVAAHPEVQAAEEYLAAAEVRVQVLDRYLVQESLWAADSEEDTAPEGLLAGEDVDALP